MEEPFNPYSEWLGFEEGRQPTHHYELLGVPVCESDPAVIAHAADALTSRVRRVRPGAHSAEWQELLDHLTAVKACLLNAAAKAAYDATLQGPASSTPPPNGESPSPVTSPGPQPQTPSGSAPQPPPARSVPQAAAEEPPVVVLKSEGRPIWVPAVALAVTVLLAGGVAFHFLRNGTDEATPKPEAATESGLSSDTELSSATSPSSAGAVSPAEQQPEPDDHPESASIAGQTCAMPDDAAIEEAEVHIRALFDSDYALASIPEVKANLAQKLLETLPALGDDPAARFVVLREIRDLASACGEAGIACEAIERLGSFRGVDTVEMKLSVLTAAAVNARGIETRQAIAQNAVDLIPQLVERDRLEDAKVMANLALAAARKARNPGLMGQAKAASEQIELLRQKN